LPPRCPNKKRQWCFAKENTSVSPRNYGRSCGSKCRGLTWRVISSVILSYKSYYKHRWLIHTKTRLYPLRIPWHLTTDQHNHAITKSRKSSIRPEHPISLSLQPSACFLLRLFFPPHFIGTYQLFPGWWFHNILYFQPYIEWWSSAAGKHPTSCLNRNFRGSPQVPPEFLMSWEVAEQTEQSARETQWSVGFLPENGWEFCGATWILDHLTKVLVVSVHQSV
jgi:hypothetical protein